MEWIWALVIGAGLLGGGYVTGCTMGKSMTQVQEVQMASRSEQRTSTEVNTMQGQITIIINPPNTNAVMFFNVSVNELTNVKVWSSNFSDRYTVTNGKTNR